MNDAGMQGTDLRKRSDIVSATLIVAHFAVVFGPLFVAVTRPWGAAWVVSLVWFGVTVHGVLNLLHECAHYHVFSRRTGSDIVGRWILGPLVFTDFDAFRRRHWDHHRFLGREGDTKDAYHCNVSGMGLPGLLIRCLTLQVAARKWRLQAASLADSPSWPVLIRTAVAQAVLIALLAAAASRFAPLPWDSALLRGLAFYLVVVVYGLAALAPFVASLRTIAEHQPGLDGAPLEGSAALRNFRCGPLSRLVFGAYGFADHATHHRYPAVPAYRLPELTKRHDPQAFAERSTYVATLATLVRRAPGDSEAASPA